MKHTTDDRRKSLGKGDNGVTHPIDDVSIKKSVMPIVCLGCIAMPIIGRKTRRGSERIYGSFDYNDFNNDFF